MYIAVIHYFGNGRKFRGDWCFSDGYITFQDLMDIYMDTYRGHVLTIVSDCSYSGRWVKQCYEFMDGQGVGVCGHHAIDKGVLMKVVASCRPHQKAQVLGYSLKCMFFDKNTGKNMQLLKWDIREGQQTFGQDFTAIICGGKVDEECRADASRTWEFKLQSERVRLVRGRNGDRTTWHYLLLVDNEVIIDEFVKALKSGTSMTLTDFGEILFSGFGRDPSNEVTEKLHKKFKIQT